MDVLVHRLEVVIREETAFRSSVDRPDVEAYGVLMRQLDEIRGRITRPDALRLEELIERRTGVTHGMVNGSR